jgi:hypothetical protein
MLTHGAREASLIAGTKLRGFVRLGEEPMLGIAYWRERLCNVDG